MWMWKTISCIAYFYTSLATSGYKSAAKATLNVACKFPVDRRDHSFAFSSVILEKLCSHEQVLAKRNNMIAAHFLN